MAEQCLHSIETFSVYPTAPSKETGGREGTQTAQLAPDDQMGIAPKPQSFLSFVLLILSTSSVGGELSEELGGCLAAGQG